LNISVVICVCVDLSDIKNRFSNSRHMPPRYHVSKLYQLSLIDDWIDYTIIEFGVHPVSIPLRPISSRLLGHRLELLEAAVYSNMFHRLSILSI
jgi:hypothetical protein